MLKPNQIPIIEFRKSWIYNIQWSRSKKWRKPPATMVWNKRERQLRRLWTKHGSAVLRTMSKITGLPWREDRIIVYLTWGVRPFSDPLTISLRPDVMSVFETMTHELIHRLLSSEKNWSKIKPGWMLFVKSYPRETSVAINHVPIHAVHEMIWGKLFPSRVTTIKTDLKLKPYIRAWELVDRLGADKVVHQIFHR